MKRLKKLNTAGFTIIELMIATMVFSVILLVGASMIMQVGKMYYRGVVSSNTQETARGVIDEISRPIQLEGGKVRINSSPAILGSGPTTIQAYAFCVGDIRYTYTTGVRRDDSVPEGEVRTGTLADNGIAKSARHVLWADDVPGPGDECEPADLTLSDPNGSSNDNGTDLLGENMMLSDFVLQQVGTPGATFYDLRVFVVSGADDLILIDTASGDHRCSGNTIGSQWCAAVDLRTNVYKRIGS